MRSNFTKEQVPIFAVLQSQKKPAFCKGFFFLFFIFFTPTLFQGVPVRFAEILAKRRCEAHTVRSALQ